MIRHFLCGDFPEKWHFNYPLKKKLAWDSAGKLLVCYSVIDKELKIPQFAFIAITSRLTYFYSQNERNLMKVENLDFGHGIVLFWYWKPFWAAYLVLMTFPKLNSSVYGILRVIPRWYFFFVAQFWFLCPAGTGNLFGTKICGERSVCPMVTKLSGFGQYLGRNLMKVEILDFGHGIVLFWYWKPFWDQNLWREIRLPNGDQTFRIWSISR